MRRVPRSQLGPHRGPRSRLPTPCVQRCGTCGPFTPPDRAGGTCRDGQLRVLRSLPKLKIKKKRGLRGEGDGTQALDTVPPSRVESPSAAGSGWQREGGSPATREPRGHRRTSPRRGRAAPPCITLCLACPPLRRDGNLPRRLTRFLLQRLPDLQTHLRSHLRSHLRTHGNAGGSR